MRRLLKYVITLCYRIANLGNNRISPSAVILRGCKLEGRNSIGKNSYLSGTTLGFGTFVGFGCEFSNCKIGKFCSIGSNIRVVSATHPSSGFISTHPAFFSDTYWFHYVKESKFKEHLTNDEGLQCTIGNDVWIGDNVLIKGGCKIGDGAIIAMGSIVLHDVKPYSIVAGIPAKEIRKRMEDDNITALEQIKWWDKPISWIEAHAEEFTDIKSFIERNKPIE